MNRKFISKSNRILRKVLNSKDNLDIIQDFIETSKEGYAHAVDVSSYTLVATCRIAKKLDLLNDFKRRIMDIGRSL